MRISVYCCTYANHQPYYKMSSEVDREILDVVYIMTYPKDPHAHELPLNEHAESSRKKMGVKMGQI